MKYCVLGAGLMGKAVAYDLLRQDDTAKVILVDNNVEALHATPLQKNNKLSLKIIDVRNIVQIEEIFKNVDATVAAIHYGFNVAFTKIAIKTKTHLCDLGGNDSVVDAQLKMNSEAKKAGVSVIPDCGLAPGLVSILVKHGLEKFNWADTVKIRVGGLPQNPKGILKYERLFSVDGLINEYVEPVRVLRNGEIKMIEPLTELEEVEFTGGAYCNTLLLEAFTTSGGASTLINTYKNRLKNLDYKTIRYAGHCNEVKKLQKEGKLTKEYLEKELLLCTNDIVLVKIIFEGNGKKHDFVIIDKAKPPFTAMMRTTAFPAAIISQMQARGQITELGVKPQEVCIPAEIFISELGKRGIVVGGI